MLDDSDVHWHRQIKSCVGGVTASVTGDPAVFVSVSAAHQGPDGGGPVAAIVDLGAGRAHRLPPADRLTGAPAVGRTLRPARHPTRASRQTVRMPTTHRLDGLDAARGLAVVSMLVAHLCPAGGIFDVSEYLTAPLFAVIIGHLDGGASRRARAPPAGTFLLDNLQRGLVLIVLGVLLQALYSQIDVVLPYLGVLVIVLAPLALLLHRMPVLTLGIAGALAVVGPIVVERAREAYPSSPTAGRGGRSTSSRGWPPASSTGWSRSCRWRSAAWPSASVLRRAARTTRRATSSRCAGRAQRRGLRPRPGHP